MHLSGNKNSDLYCTCLLHIVYTVAVTYLGSHHLKPMLMLNRIHRYPTGSDPAVIAVLDEIGKDLTDLTRIVLVKMPSGSDGEDKEDSGSQEEMEGDAEVEFEHRFEEEAEGGANPSSSISPVSIITPTDPSPLPASTYDRDTNRTAGGVADMTDREYFEWIKAKLPVEEQEEFQRRTEDQQEFQRRIEDQQEFQRRIDSLLSRAA